MYPKKQKFFLLGLSRSGLASANFLLKQNAAIYVYDDVVGKEMEECIKKLESQGAIRVQKEELFKTAEYCDVLVLSPGIPIDHPVSVAFRRLGKSVIGETELAARYIRCPVIAVTGTNGKTTTVSMIESILKEEGINAKACGNIGEPMINCAQLLLDGVAVAEISSFQLETLNAFLPHIAAILNISEDHLNRHYNMENYVFLKSKLLKNLSEAEYAILNYDDEIVRNFFRKTKAHCIYFSVRERVDGAYYQDGALYFYDEKIIEERQLATGGIHNVQNALCAIICAKLMGVKTQTIGKALSQFRGIKHRVQFVGEIDGVKYVDDSKGTNVDATMKAVNSLKGNIVLLLGGKDKGYDYDKLFAFLQTSAVRRIVLFGENRFRLLESAQNAALQNISLCEKMEMAVHIAKSEAKVGDTVLLSPASASFDAFSGYEERGEKFAAIVHSFEEKKVENHIEGRAFNDEEQTE